MRVLIAGGVFRLAEEELRMRQPSPERVLASGLRHVGVHVQTCRLEDLTTVGMSRRFDVVHVHHLSKGAVTAALSPLAGPLVFTAHSFDLPRSPSHRLGMSTVMRRMRAGVCLSKPEAMMVAEAYPSSRHKLTIIPNGIDLPVPAHERQLHGSIRALYVGQLIALKQLDRALAVVARIPQVTLRLVFHNDEELARLRRLCEDLAITDRVAFVGQRSGDELFAEYKAADMLLLPSLHEALPSVVTEALSTGLPVVASRVGGIPDQVRDAGVLTENTGSDSFVDGVNRLIGDFANYSRRARERAEAIRGEFDVEAMVERHVALYERVREMGR